MDQKTLSAKGKRGGQGENCPSCQFARKAAKEICSDKLVEGPVLRASRAEVRRFVEGEGDMVVRQKESILILGGGRSGKSTYALQRAREWDGPLVYLATAEGRDEEMRQRIKNHRSQRRSRRWETIEEPLAVAWTLKEMDEGIGGVVLDCVTLWVANALLAGQREDLASQVDELVAEIPLFSFNFLAVSNEVGLGLVPDNATSREFRDLLGGVNQSLAQACQEVVFMAAGIPMKIKG
jgi:adenosylcobinamide kinase/adenosylcobinamide-phosphate guanylyltransferase